MNTRTGPAGQWGSGFESPPGTEAPRRRPRLRYELLGCAWHGHDLVGTDAATVVADDAVVVRESGGGPRWHRCLRCDAWVALPPPARPTRDGVPGREEIVLPLRGRPLKSRYILRLIAIDRGLHFLVLAALAGGVFAVLANQTALQQDLTAATSSVQGLFGADVLASFNTCSPSPRPHCGWWGPGWPWWRWSSWSKESGCGAAGGGPNTSPL